MNRLVNRRLRLFLAALTLAFAGLLLRATSVAVERALGVEADRLYPLLADRSRGFVYVSRQADPAQALALRRLRLPGFGFYPEERRTYPQRSIAAQVLGYVGIDGNGLAGLELQFDHQLAG